MDGASQVGAQGLSAGAQVLSRPADEFVNDASVEEMWAIKAFEHSKIYFNLLCAVDPSILKLTQHDNEIYSEFRKHFPDLKIDVLDEDEMKSEAGKEKWREFIDLFKDKVEDHSFGTLLRVDSGDEYSAQNTILVIRVQFLAIELARNREGFNGTIKKKFKPSKS